MKALTFSYLCGCGGVHVHVQVLQHGHMCVEVELDIRCLPQPLSTLHIEARSPAEPRAC